MRLFNKLFLTLSLISLLSMSSNSQTPVKNYDAEWKKVEAFTEKALPKSALAEVQKIYALAKKEKQEAQIIKSLIYISDLQNETRENNEVFSIAEVEQEIAGSTGPAKAILNSLLADMYLDQYRNLRWKLYNRTATINFKKEDINTWSTEDFHEKIAALYLASLSNEKMLQATPLDAFDAIMIKGNVRHLRPTLFDLLANRALIYFQNNERDIKKPAYPFEIDQASAFDPAADFIHRKFDTKDTASLLQKALLIYQQLLAFHLEDAKPDALIDADLNRIEFVKDHSIHPDKDQLYYHAINHIAHQYENLPAASQAWYLVAAYYHDKARNYTPYGDSSHRYDELKAKDICEKVLTQKDSSEGKINCFNLLQEITQPSMQFAIEKVNVPAMPFRALVSYQNFTTLYLRLIKADQQLKEALMNQYGEDYWPSIMRASPIKSWKQELPATGDMQIHRTEIKIDALPAGEYVLVAANNPEFSGSSLVMGARFFYVSGISYVNNDKDYFVLNRDNGQPIAKADIQLWEQKYDYKTYKYSKVKAGTYTTDEHGYFKIKLPKTDNSNYGNYAYLLEISKGNDKLFMTDIANRYYDYGDNNQQTTKDQTSIFFFTDRAIYRPGQTLYFKGIVLSNNRNEKTAAVKAGYATTVILRDANYQDIDTINVETNEYGSFNGSFQLPQNGLNGQFSIYTKKDGGIANFRVEEYKRPKFLVDYEPVKGIYQVNDSITITGFAKAYAGNNIDGAKVTYRVVRQPRYLYPWLFSRWWQPPAEEMEITHGEIMTDKDGKFKLSFKAIPDLSIDQKLEPVFDYTIYADVTDINGETRSGEKTVSVSYKSLVLVTNIPEISTADSLQKLSIRTENMSGEFQAALVNVKISKLKAEKRLIRNRYWERPDQFVMSKESYISYFPNDEYDNESDFKSWDIEKTYFTGADSTNEKGEWLIKNQSFPAGFYEVEISTTDQNGKGVRDIRYIELTNEKNKQFIHPAYLWTGIRETTIEPGETAKIEWGSSASNLFVVQQVDHAGITEKNSSTHYSFLGLSNEKRVDLFEATEQDRGGYGVNWMFVKQNRVYQLNQTIHVPWTNKDLTVEYASFRDKTLPGADEKWKIKISGYKKEKVAAEMLATMYDASLDQFVSHNWNKPAVWPAYYNRNSWNGIENFSQVQSVQQVISEQQSKNLEKRYDILFGNIKDNYRYFESFGRTDIRIKGMSSPAIMPDKEVSAVNDSSLNYKQQGEFLVIGETAKKVTNEDPGKEKLNIPGEINIRKNFNETVFFFPDLRTGSDGSIEFSFSMPDALTKWKFMAMAHTKEAAFGLSTKEIITQKELMVQPNPPRFLREGDKMEFNAKIVNLSANEFTGTASLQLFDAATNEPMDGWYQNMVPNQYFTVAAGQSEALKFPIEVPYLFNKALTWRIVAKAANYSDGEENTLPVLTNRILVTETLPIAMHGAGTKNFSFDKLLQSGNSESLQNQALVVEYSANPAWYAVQALPYLMEYPYECAEQTWNRYYANSLASHITNASPRIKAVFEKWKITDTAALQSNLQKNEELKGVLLAETPWVLAAKNEAEQKRNIALLFDMVKMTEQLNRSYDKLKQMQSSNGGFVWFKGGPDDRYITQYIVTGIGHLKKLNAFVTGQEEQLSTILSAAIPYLDLKIKEDYDALLKNKTDLKKYVPPYTALQYLYMRSFFPEYKIAAASQKAFDYFSSRAQQSWTGQSKYMQGMIALALYRAGDNKTTAAILKSLKETSITSDELGMYWKDQRKGWFWYEAPVETQSLLIEAFQEAGKDLQTVNNLRTWLLKNKQTNNWKTTKATAEACYALLLQGSDWLTNDPQVTIQLGNLAVNSSSIGSTEAGTGYFKKTIEGNKVLPQMGNISVTVAPTGNNTSASWGAVYWQYFEDLDKITNAATPLSLVKKLFIEKNTDKGPVLDPVNDGDLLQVGDKIKVRIELRVDRDMEYVHMKDMRASALEPVNVLSGYQWQGGLGYYESTKDASTNFFFNYLRKGTYVFEYTLFTTGAGNFSNGITTIQCMYAPEFTSHSAGVRINIE